jgi:undecaprenyl-diphosphatase
MSVPVIGGAAAFKGLEVARDGLPPGTAMPFAVGMAAAALSGIAAIWFTLAYLKRHTFNLFVAYRLVIGVGVLVLIVAGVRSGMGV